MKVENLITSETDCRKGRTLVSRKLYIKPPPRSLLNKYRKIVCTKDEINDSIRGVIRRILDKDIHLEELKFYPPSSRVYK